MAASLVLYDPAATPAGVIADVTADGIPTSGPGAGVLTGQVMARSVGRNSERTVTTGIE